MITKTYHPEPGKECVWLVKMWVGTPSETPIGIYSSQAKAEEIAHAMKTKVNEYADYDVDCFYLDGAPVDGLELLPLRPAHK